jgi:hypothetical protein
MAPALSSMPSTRPRSDRKGHDSGQDRRRRHRLRLQQAAVLRHHFFFRCYVGFRGDDFSSVSMACVRLSLLRITAEKQRKKRAVFRCCLPKPAQKSFDTYRGKSRPDAEPEPLDAALSPMRIESAPVVGAKMVAQRRIGDRIGPYAALFSNRWRSA